MVTSFNFVSSLQAKLLGKDEISQKTGQNDNWFKKNVASKEQIFKNQIVANTVTKWRVDLMENLSDRIDELDLKKFRSEANSEIIKKETEIVNSIKAKIEKLISNKTT